MHDRLQQPSENKSEDEILHDFAELCDVDKMIVDRLSQQLSSDDSAEVDETLNLTNDFLKYNYDDGQNFAIARVIIYKNLERLVEIINGEKPEQALQAATAMYHSWVDTKEPVDPNSQIVATFKSLLPKIITDYPLEKSDEELTFAPLAQEFIDDFSCRDSYMVPAIQPRIAQHDNAQILRAFGCLYDTGSMRRSWISGMKPSKHKEGVVLAMNTMLELEANQPGIVSDLQTTNHLRNFQRYTPEMLYDMHQSQIDHPDKDYVLVIQSVEDHNNAFNEGFRYHDLNMRLNEMGCGLRIYECDSVFELDSIAEQVLENHATFDAHITAEIIAGHGNNEFISLGIQELEADHLDNAHNKITEAFTDGADVILDSCSTGKETDGEPSLARKLAIAMGRTVIAPTENVWSKRTILATKKGDGIDLMINFKQRKNIKNTKKSPKHWVRSKPVHYDGKTCSDRPD